MFSEESLEARQKNEFEALQGIYGDDLRDLRGRPVWNKWVPLNLSLTLTPQQGMSGTQEIHVKVDLHIVCPEKYPNSIPQILLENSKGLPNTVLVELQEKLEQKAEELKGEEMIFQLCQYVQEFLLPHNKPTSKSFYDEMLDRQKEKEQMDMQAKRIEQDRQRQFMIEEVQRRQEILKSEAKLRREHRHSSENDDTDMNRRFSLNRIKDDSSTESSDDYSCQHKGTIMTFGSKEIQRGRCIKHSTPNHFVFNGIDKESGELMIVSEWSINIKNKKDLPSVQRQVSRIEQEINYLTKLKHSNLAHYYSLTSQTNENNVVVYLLKEFIYGSNCYSLFLSQNIKIDMDFLKHIAKGILLSLDYLHRNNVVHKDIRDTNVYLNDAGVVKLSNYSIHRRLLDLTSLTQGTYSKKTDIYNFGKLLLSLLQGNSISDDNLVIPDSIQSELYDFLTRCLATDESDRYTTTQLLNHSFFNKEIIHCSPQHAGQVPAEDRNISPETFNSDLLLLSQSHANGKSRINNEFEFLQPLGKGAFGDVIKVRNKLDGGYYAIKRIQLNPKNKTLNKKIVREVKLLSRLNHENVVRYYNSWIETTTIKEESASSNFSSIEQKLPKIVKQDEFTLTDDIEAHAPPMKNVEVSITYDSKSQAAFNDSSDDDSSDDDGAWGAIYGEDSDSDGIEFEHDTESQPKEETTASISPIQNSQSPDSTQEIIKKIDFMYIQMEFCEKSTLRTAIDDNLHLNEQRLWRLIREIVEGLAHIHQQGMIHRDLKPVNIFLDSGDHVKIGDFGLATTMIKSRPNEYLLSKSSTESDREDGVDESKTGLIGTALYVAPEISTAAKVVYNQKVDIYSLGIIFFEMCYKPLETSMERIKILTKLRLKEIIFPDEFINKENEKKQFLIRWLLNHDISKRPSSQELLQSKYVPPVVEECSLRESVRHALSSPQLKAYKYLIASCFKQSVTPAQDITYDKDPSVPNVVKPLQLYDFVKETCIRIFRRHGGQNLSTPLLMPKSKFYEGLDSCVKLMTHFGTIVSLPHDLRFMEIVSLKNAETIWDWIWTCTVFNASSGVEYYNEYLLNVQSHQVFKEINCQVPFARYIAWNGITTLRRYSIERVYREKKVFGFQPRELYECAFDIVSPTQGNLMSDAEVLYIVHEIINELPGVKNKHFLIRLNHTSLLKAILLHCGIKDNHQEVYNMISDTKEGKVPKYQLQHYFITLGLSDSVINFLLNLFNSEFEMSKVVNQFHMITKKKSGEAGRLARQALQDLKNIGHNAEAYGVKFDIVVSPGLVYNVQQYSGMICQFVCELKKKHKHGNMEVLAAGGRYDSMISWYRSIMEQANIPGRDMYQSAVGISISLDKLVQAIQNEQSSELPQIDYLDVVVCSVGTKQLIKEKAKILRSLWAAGIRCALLEEVTNMEAVNLQANELKVPHIIMLKDNEQGTVIVKTVRSWEKNLIQEKPCSTSELVEQLQRSIRERNEGYQEYVPAVSSALSRSESKTACGDHCQEPKVEISFVTADKFDKLSSNTRKRYENQIRSQLDGLFRKLTGHVIVLGLSIESNVIRTLASYLEFDSEPHFQKTVENVIERHQRHKKYLNNVCDKIYDQKSKSKNPTIVLYSLPDYFFKVIF